MARTERLLAGADEFERQLHKDGAAAGDGGSCCKRASSARLWTIGLASCGSLCGLSPSEWQALSRNERDQRRGKGNPAVVRAELSVIDHLGELDTCLADINLRRLKERKAEENRDRYMQVAAKWIAQGRI